MFLSIYRLKKNPGLKFCATYCFVVRFSLGVAINFARKLISPCYQRLLRNALNEPHTLDKILDGGLV
jgi:hypothetical protein